jgi:hypothetical protein
MHNGPLYQEDYGDSGSPGQAAADAANSFGDSPPGAVAPCSSLGPGGSGKRLGKASHYGGSAWTQADIKANLDSCDGGTYIWSRAKAANGGNDPVIKDGSTRFGAETNLTNGVITINPGMNKCEAKQLAMMELTNLAHKSDFDNSDCDCESGTLSREDYIRAGEEIEWDGMKNALAAFDACRATWGCGDTATSIFDCYRGATSFDDYYSRVPQSHKDVYGDDWDMNCKANWDKQHPSEDASASDDGSDGAGSGDQPDTFSNN